jgi:TP901 family phage tail tape measure protein
VAEEEIGAESGGGGSTIAGRLKYLVEIIDKFTQPLEKMEEKIGGFRSTLSEFAGAAAEIFAGIEVLKSTSEAAIEFEQAQLRLKQATGATAEQLREAREQADQLSMTYGTSAEAITQMQMRFSQFSGSLEEGMRLSELGAKLVAATGIEAQDAARILGAALTNLSEPGKSVEETMQAIADKTALLLTRFPGSADSAARVGRDFAKLAATMKSFGLDLDQTLALMAALNRSGIGGARGSGSFLQQIVNELLKLDKHGVPALMKYHFAIVKTKEGQIDLIRTLELMKEMGPKAVEKFAQATGVAGQEVMLLLQQLDKLPDLVSQFRNSAGTLDKTAKEATETAAVQFKNFGNAVEALKVALGQSLLPVLTRTIQSIVSLLKVVIEFVDTHPLLNRWISIGVQLAAVTVTVVGLWTALAKGIAVLKMLNLTLMANPILAGIAVLAIAAELLYDNWDQVRSSFQEGFSEISEGWKEFTALFKTPFWQETFSALGQIFGPFVEAFKKANLDIVQLFTSLPSSFQDLIGRILRIIWDLVVGVNELAAVPFRTLYYFFHDTIDKIAGEVSAFLQKIGDAFLAIPDKAKQVVEGIVSAFQWLTESPVWKALAAVIDAVATPLDKISEAFGWVGRQLGGGLGALAGSAHSIPFSLAPAEVPSFAVPPPHATQNVNQHIQVNVHAPSSDPSAIAQAARTSVAAAGKTLAEQQRHSARANLGPPSYWGF